MKPIRQLVKQTLDYAARQVAARNAGMQERLLLAQGKQLANWARGLGSIANIEDAEFRIFSQFGDDGIIQYITSHTALPARTFIEFGVEDYEESNTRFLLMNNNWSGFIMDGSEGYMAHVRQCAYHWRHDLLAEAAFVTTENINALLARRRFADVGLLHIDIDGNDYWVWKAIDSINPGVVIVEYNSVFGPERAITIPYAADFQRTKAHFSNLYFGASIAALTVLARQKGYALVGSNSAGNNAYFVRKDLLNADIREVPCGLGYRESKFRESRNADGAKTYLSGVERLKQLKGLPVFNVESNVLETL